MMIASLAMVYAVVMLVFAVGFVIVWIRQRREIQSYKRLGFVASVIFVVFELAILIITANQSPLSGFGLSAVVIVIGEGLGIIRISAFVNPVFATVGNDIDDGIADGVLRTDHVIVEAGHQLTDLGIGKEAQ